MVKEKKDNYGVPLTNAFFSAYWLGIDNVDGFQVYHHTSL